VTLTLARSRRLAPLAPGNVPDRESPALPAYRSRSGDLSRLAIPSRASCIPPVAPPPTGGSSLLLSGTSDVAGGSSPGRPGLLRRILTRRTWMSQAARISSPPFRIG
jgi:hypothetical protein